MTISQQPIVRSTSDFQHIQRIQGRRIKWPCDWWRHVPPKGQGSICP